MATRLEHIGVAVPQCTARVLGKPIGVEPGRSLSVCADRATCASNQRMKSVHARPCGQQARQAYALVRAGAPPGTRTPNPRIKSPLLCSRIPRYYLRLHARTSEDTPLTCGKSYRVMTAAASPYRDIRANMERTSIQIGLDHHAAITWTMGGKGIDARRAVHVRRSRIPAEAVDTIRDPCWQHPRSGMRRPGCSGYPVMMSQLACRWTRLSGTGRCSAAWSAA